MIGVRSRGVQKSTKIDRSSDPCCTSQCSNYSAMTRPIDPETGMCHITAQDEASIQSRGVNTGSDLHVDTYSPVHPFE